MERHVGHSPFQIVVTTCDGCKRTWQDGRGERVEVDAEVGERAWCDSQRVSATATPGMMKRAVQSIPLGFKEVASRWPPPSPIWDRIPARRT